MKLVLFESKFIIKISYDNHWRFIIKWYNFDILKHCFQNKCYVIANIIVCAFILNDSNMILKCKLHLKHTEKI